MATVHVSTDKLSATWNTDVDHLIGSIYLHIVNGLENKLAHSPVADEFHISDSVDDLVQNVAIDFLGELGYNYDDFKDDAQRARVENLMRMIVLTMGVDL